MTRNGAFILSRALPSDIAEIVEIEFRTFTDEFVKDVFMGPDTPEGHKNLTNEYIDIMKTDFADYWIKVTDSATGKIVAASNWKIYQSALPEHKHHVDLSRLSHDPERLKMAMAVLDGIDATRRKFMTEPYLQLYICFTDPAYQRQGAGSMMLKWGCELADLLQLPAWVEASPDGIQLYKVFGFSDVEFMKGDALAGSTMKRPAAARAGCLQT